MGSGFLFENRLIMMLWLWGAQLLCMHAGFHVVSPGGGGGEVESRCGLCMCSRLVRVDILFGHLKQLQTHDVDPGDV